MLNTSSTLLTVLATLTDPCSTETAHQLNAQMRWRHYWLLEWIDTAPGPHVHYHYLAEMLRHLSAAWSLRHEPNVVLVRYADLSANLAGEMRSLAARGRDGRALPLSRARSQRQFVWVVGSFCGDKPGPAPCEPAGPD